MKDKLKKHISKKIFTLIGESADNLNVETYVIGGYVRDAILERPSKDIDVVCVGSGIALAERVASQLKGAKLSVFKNFGTAQVKYRDIEVEFVGARKESYRLDSRKPIVENGTLEDDQNRRDFTINAMAVCLNKERFGELIDPFGGLKHLEEKLIKTPLEPDITFSDDPLRMLRAIRFATQLKFTIEEETFASIARTRERISIISKERINDELNKIMASPVPSIGFVLLDECGLLELIFPEFKALQGVEIIKGRGHKDVFYHTLQVVDNLASVSDNLWLRWAALLHDIAKPATKRWDNRMGWTFHNHNFIGEKMVPKLFNRMKLPQNEKMKYVQKLVGLHMRPIALVEEEVSDSAVRRLLFDAGDDVDDLMMLCEADITTRNQEKQERIKNNFALVRRKLRELEERDRVRNFQPPVSGEEIMEAYGLSPSRLVGDLKTIIKDSILDGDIPNDRDAAWKLLEQIAQEKGLKRVGK